MICVINPKRIKSMKLFTFTTVISSSLISLALLALLNFIAGEDLARELARVLHLGNGVLLAAIVGGFTGLWLAVGGVKRAARLAGTMLGLVVALALWLYGQSYIRIIDAFLLGVFGKVGATFTPLVGMMILFGAMRWATESSALYIEAFMRYVRLVTQEREKATTLVTN